MNSKLGFLGIAAVLVIFGIGAYFLMGPPADFAAIPEEEAQGDGSSPGEAAPSTDSTPVPAAPEPGGEAAPLAEAPDAVAADPAEADTPQEATKRREGRGSLTGTLSYAQQQGDLGKVQVEITLVDWEDHEERGDDALVRNVRPDAEGNFKVDNVPWGSYVAIATSTDGFFGLDDASVRENYTEGTFAVQLFPNGEIAGRVTADDGSPVPGARVFSTHYKGMLGDTDIDRDWVKALTQKTDENGEFVLPHLIDGTYELVAKAPGYGTGSLEDVKIGTTNAHIVLPGTGSVSGTVVDDYSGEPVPDITVKLASGFWMDNYTATSDAQGAFSFSAAPAGEHTLAVDDERYITGEKAQPVRVAAGKALSDITLPVTLGGLVTGRVYDKETSRGLAEVEIYLSSMSNAGEERRVYKNTTTDALGAYTFDGLPTGPYTLRRRDVDGYPNNYDDPTMRRNITIRAGEQLSDIDFALAKGLTLRGTVVDGEGAPVAEANVSAGALRGGQYLRAESREDGRFELAGFTVGSDYFVRAYKSDLAGPAVGPLTIDGEGDPDEVELVLYPASTISGIVVDPAGKPVADVGIIARRAERQGFGSTIHESGADGTFEIDNLTTGSYAMVLSAPNNHNFNGEPQETVEISKAGEQITDLKLVYDGNAGMTIAGRVVNVQGEGISNANINANGPGSYVDGRTDGDGNFELTGLKEGTFNVNVQHGEYSSTNQSGVAAGTQDLVIEMRGRGTLDGHVYDARTRHPVTEFSIVHERGSRGEVSPWRLANQMIPMLDEEGHFTLEGVEEGDATIAVTAPGYAMKHQVVGGVVADEVLSGVEVFLEAGFGLEGVVVDGSGAPVVGAMIFHGSVPQEYERDRAKKAVSGSDGTFLIEGIPQGPNTISAYHPNYAPAINTVDVAGPNSRIELVMGLGAVVEGIVTLNGEPVTGAYINVQVGQGNEPFRTHAPADGNGHYEIKGLPPGEASIHAGFQMPDGQRKSLQARETLQDGLTYTINFDAVAGSAIIRGMLLEGAGNPRSGHVSIQMQGGGATESAFQQVDASGQFEFTGVSAGNVRISGNMQTANGYRSVTREIDVEAGGDHTLDLNVDDLINITCTLGNIPAGEATIVYALHGEHVLPATATAGELQALFGDMAGHGQAQDGVAMLGVSEPGTYTIVGMVHRGDQRFILTSGVITIPAGQQEAALSLNFTN